MIATVATHAPSVAAAAAPTPFSAHRSAAPSTAARARRAVATRYVAALTDGRFGAAYELLNRAAQRYYRDPANFRSVYAADAYRIERFAVVGERDSGAAGSLFFVRETARYRDHAHDLDLLVTATVPVGVVRDAGDWRIKDPGHPWRAFASGASASANGLSVTLKKLSFFERRIEVVVTFANRGNAFITLLPYGRSLLRDAGGGVYRLIETRNWSLTDRALFEGIRLAPSARYTGTLAFACEPLDNTPRTFALTLAPLLASGADTPFTIELRNISAPAGLPAGK